MRSEHEDALPLIMTHGWPGSVIELLDSVGPLTDPTAHGGSAEDAFHLVLPSIPGYGFSGEPKELGWGPGRVAQAWAELMQRLGYTRYVAQGGDVGASITDAMGRQAPEGLIGIHTNLLVTGLAGGDHPSDYRGGKGGDRRARQLQGDRFWLLPRAGHAAGDDRLRTAGFTGRARGLDARPRHGQLLQDRRRLRGREADWQPHPRQHPRQHHDVLADRHRRLGGPVVLGERTGAAPPAQAPPPVTIPVGFTTFPDEIFRAPRSWVEQSYPSLVYFNEVDKGGHFAAWEEPAAVRDRDPGDVQVGSLAMATGVDLPVEGRLASFDGAAGWLNSPPLTPEELRGKVVLVDFWTYTCINWLRTLAWVRAWSDRYGDQGLVVVGVHTPEFPFERDADNVTRAVAAMDVRYPVALDPDYAVWNAFANSYWPAAYIADAEGQIRHHHFGEGAYDEQERAIQSLLGVDGELVSVEPAGFEVQADWANLDSPETYLGSQQGCEPGAARGPVAQPVVARGRLEPGAPGGRARERRGPALVPLPRPRRPSGDGAARARRGGAVPGARRRRGRRATRTGATSTTTVAARSPSSGSTSSSASPAASRTGRCSSTSSRPSRPTASRSARR